MNDYRVYTYSENGYNEFLYAADDIVSVVNYHSNIHPDDIIYRVEKVQLLER